MAQIKRGYSRSNWKQKPVELETKLWQQKDSGTCLMVLFHIKAPRLLLCWVGVDATLDNGFGVQEESCPEQI